MGPGRPQPVGNARAAAAGSRVARGGLFPDGGRKGAAGFPAWIHMRDWRRPRAASGPRPPVSRLRMERGKLSMRHT